LLPVIPAGVAAGYHRCFWQPSWQGGGCGAEGVSCSFRSRGRPEVYSVQQLIRSSQLLWFRGGTDGGPFRSEEIRGSRCQNVDSANCGLCSSCCMKLDEYPHTISHFTFHVTFCACRIQKVGRFVRIYFVCALQVWAPDSGGLAREVCLACWTDVSSSERRPAARMSIALPACCKMAAPEAAVP
jgi:hypothetical protein